MDRRQFLLGTAALAASGPVTMSPAFAQANPFEGKNIRFIVPFAAGSATDTVARMYGEHMARTLSASIIVENRAGANGMIGADAVAKAAPDGLTILVGTNSTNAAAPALFNRVPFDHTGDFTPISFLGSVPLVVGVPANSPFQTLRDLIAAAKARPGALNYASASASQRVSTAMLESMTGIKMNMVPYRASPQAITDLIAGRLDLFVADMAVMLPQVQANTVRALAMTSARRVSQLPNVPTVDEAAGISGYELIAWFGMFGPANLPEPMAARLNAAARAAGTAPDVLQRLGEGLGMSVATSSPAELAQRVREETVKWQKAVDEAGIEKT
jgi:tripartite-type tricarboxylate transporter receptor subunit TctC